MIGNILLTTALMAGIFTVVMYYLTFKGYKNTLQLARFGYHAMAVMVIVSAAMLLYAVLTHQYEYKYVYNYSGSGLPTGLLLSTFYAGQEGSFMLWTFFTAIIGLILLEYTSKRGDLEPRVMMVFTLAASFLLIMVSPLLKSPFNYIWSEPSFIDLKNINQSFLSLPALQSFFFTDQSSNQHFIRMSSDLYAVLKANGIAINDLIIQGKGLNPLLQNFWMQIHPPMLFVGFSMSAVPFSFAIAAMLKNEYKDWVKQSLPWVLSGAMVLGLAIMLGGYWAYGVLGWGGYWGWDPVENSSFVPWLVGVASIHTMLVQKKSQEKGGASRFVKTNLILSVMTYVLVLYSTFLTRSGILGDASVHSFVDPGRAVYLFLVLFLSVFAIIGVGGIVYRWKYLSEHFNYEENGLSRELALFTGSVALIASAIIVLVGTSAPIFGQTVETRFYNELNLPIAIIIGLLNGLSLLLKWKQTQGKQLLKQSVFSITSAVVLTAIVIIFGGVHQFMMILFTFSTAFTLFVNAEIAYKIIRGNKLFLGAYVAHTGIALFLLGVIATSGYSEKKEIDLVKNKPVSAFGYDLTFTGYTPIEDGKKFAFNVEVKKGDNTRVASPVMFIADFNNSLMREPDIITGFAKDVYVAPLGYSDGREENQGNEITLAKGEDYQFNGADIKFISFDIPEEVRAKMMSGGDFQIGAKLNVTYQGESYDVEAAMKSTGGNREFIPVEIKKANLKITAAKFDPSGKVSLNIATLDNSSSAKPVQKPEVLSVEASIKPFISLVWIGVLVMVFGFIISATRRSKESVA